MAIRYLFQRRFFLLIIVPLLLVNGCAKKNPEPQAQQQSAKSDQEQGKIPDQLKEIESSIEKILKALNGPAVGVKEEQGKQGASQEKAGQEEGKQDKEKEQSSGQGGQKSQSENKQDNKQEGQQGGQKEGQQGAQQGGQKKGEQASPQPAQQDPWEKITPIINTLHYQWNSYMPMAVKSGANKNLIDNFSAALNSLTNTIISKNKTNTLMAANHLYSYIPDLYFLYKGQTSPEIKRVRYLIRNAMLNAMTANWAQADTDMGNLKSSWALFKNSVDKEQQEIAGKLDFSIMELEKVIKEKNQPLCDIKGRVALSNVEALEKAAEKKK